MSNSASSEIFYGYSWKSEDELEFFGKELDSEKDEYPFEWARMLLLHRGGKNPWDDFPETPKGLNYLQQREFSDNWVKEHREEIDASIAEESKIEKEFPVTVSSWGSNDYGTPYVAVKGSVTGNDWDSAYELDPEKVFNKEADWDEILDRFFEVMELRKPHEKAKWFLVASYG